MIERYIIIAVLGTHFLADFVLQSDYMTQNKSKSNLVLLFHVSVYASCLLWFGWQYALLNGAFHFGTDYVTSRATSRLWVAGKRHWFFVVIGLDQFIHAVCLIATL